MRKFFLWLFLALLCIPTFAQSIDEAKAESRKIIYAAKPVDKVRDVSDARLSQLISFAVQNPKDSLSAEDQSLAYFLFVIERQRRTKSPDDFSLFLQEEKERLVDLKKDGMPELVAIKIENWIDLYKLNLIFD